MNEQRDRMMKIIGWFLFLFAVGFFCLQMGFLYIHENLKIEYIDDQIFYIVNIVFVICLVLALLILLGFTKMWRIICLSMAFLFIIINIQLLVVNNKEVQHTIGISPNYKHVLSLKTNMDTGETTYYRDYYGIFARPREKLPYETTGEFKVEWLSNDIGAVTYKATDDTVHQFIATYGSRGGGGSYYQVAPYIRGRWQGENVEVISDMDGITVTYDDTTELFEFDHIVQFGTIAIVLTRENEAAWTISLNASIEIDTAAHTQPSGEISLYEATMWETEPIILYNRE